MTAIIRWLAPGEIVTDLSERVDNGGEPRFSVSTYAEECSIATSSIVVRDEDGDFHIVGLNAANIEEDDSIAADPYIWVGRFGMRTEERGRYLTGASRDIVAEVHDINTIASNYIAGDTEDADRPAEDHGTRMAWVASQIPNIDDDSLVLITSAKSMPAYDYTGMSWQQVIDDCCRASGYQAFIYYDGANDLRQLVYADAAGEWLTTDLRLTNLITDVTGDGEGLTFYADMRQEWDPSRVASRVYGRGDGIDGFATYSPTEVLHARRDVAMDFPTVRSEATLNDRMGRSLASDLSTESRTLKGTTELPSTHASMLRAGMRIAVHATHLTGLQDDFVWVRLLTTTHTLLTPTQYRVEFEAEVFESIEEIEISCENDLNQPFGTVTVDSSGIPYGDPENGVPSDVNDGDDGSRNGYNGGYVGVGAVWWTSDLASSRDVVGFVTLADWNCSQPADQYTTFQFSDNGTDWTECPVTMLSTVNEVSTKWRSTWEIDAGTISHRYWRVTFSADGGGGFHCLGWMYTWCIVGTG